MEAITNILNVLEDVAVVIGTAYVIHRAAKYISEWRENQNNVKM